MRNATGQGGSFLKALDRRAEYEFLGVADLGNGS